MDNDITNGAEKGINLFAFGVRRKKKTKASKKASEDNETIEQRERMIVDKKDWTKGRMFGIMANAGVPI